MASASRDATGIRNGLDALRSVRRLPGGAEEPSPPPSPGVPVAGEEEEEAEGAAGVGESSIGSSAVWRDIYFFPMQQFRFEGERIAAAYSRISKSGGNRPSARFSTCKLLIHSSVTPSKCTKARRASSFTSVRGPSMPALFISSDAEFTANSAPLTLGK